MFKPPYPPPSPPPHTHTLHPMQANCSLLPDDIFVIKAGNQLYFTHDSLGKLTAFWVERYTLHSVQTIVKLISHLERKEKGRESKLEIISVYSLQKYDALVVLAQLMGRRDCTISAKVC